jgi:hypothetical protein
MGRAIAVRTDYTIGKVRGVARPVKDAAETRRLLAIAAVLDGASRAKAGKDQANPTIKAASQPQLRALDTSNPKIAEFEGKLSVGCVHATGKIFAPFVRRDLYVLPQDFWTVVRFIQIRC